MKLPKLKPDPLLPPTPVSGSAWEVRALRVIVAAALVFSTIIMAFIVLHDDGVAPTQADVYAASTAGLFVGWLISKSGTVIDWLFGGSESGTRRADALITQAVGDSEPAAGTTNLKAAGDLDVSVRKADPE